MAQQKTVMAIEVEEVEIVAAPIGMGYRMNEYGGWMWYQLYE